MKIDGGSFMIEGTVGDWPAGLDTAVTALAWIPSKGAFRGGAVTSSGWWGASDIGLNSFGFGLDPWAPGDYSVAMGGPDVEAQGDNSLALCGPTTYALGARCVAIGPSVQTHFNDCTSVGGSLYNQGNSGTTLVGKSLTCLPFVTQGALIGNQSTIGRSGKVGVTFPVGIGGNVLIESSQAVGIGVNIDVGGAEAYTSMLAAGINVGVNANGAVCIGTGVSGTSKLTNTTANTMWMGVGSDEPTFIMRNNTGGVGTYSNIGIIFKDPLSTLDVGGSVGYQSKTITFADTPYTLADELVLLVDTTGGDVTVNLPQISGVDRRMYHIKAIEYGSGAGTNDVIIHPFAGDFIDQNNPSVAPAATDIVIDRGDSVQIVADTFATTDTWWII
jgi:hypothetical protein